MSTALLRCVWAAFRGLYSALYARTIGAAPARVIGRSGSRAGQRRLAQGTDADPANDVPPSFGLPAVTRPHGGRTTSIAVVRFPAADEQLAYPGLFMARELRGPYLLDLRSATEGAPRLCAEIGRAWTASPADVPRLGVLLTFEGWVMAHEAVALALEPLAHRGIRVQVFYEDQLSGQVAEWFRTGTYRHNVVGVLSALSTQWCPSSTWPHVIDALGALVRTEIVASDQPHLLVRLAELALSCGGADVALALTSEALRRVQRAASEPLGVGVAGSEPRDTRCLRSRALRQLGAALLAMGRTAEGIAMMDQAIDLALETRDEAVAAVALCQRGMVALNHADYTGAAARFRAALQLLMSPAGLHLRAMVHHNLALALLHEHQLGEAEHHARTALSLRADWNSHWAQEDQILIARLRDARLVN